MRSPTVSNGSGTARIGTRKVTATALAKTTNGAARKSHGAGARRPDLHPGDDRFVEVALEPGQDTRPVLDRLHEVARVGMEVDGEVLGGTVELGEDPAERLGEGRRRVLHARGLRDAPASPGVAHPE